MHLSRTERWILANQYRILAALIPDEAKDFDEARDILERGYELEYDAIIQHIYPESSMMPESACREVIDTLQMFRVLRASIRDLEEKPQVEEHTVTFGGFDGNEETQYMSYAKFVINQQGRFSEFRGVDFNSHAEMLPVYRRQLAQWGYSSNPHKLTKEDVERIAQAALARD